MVVFLLSGSSFLAFNVSVRAFTASILPSDRFVFASNFSVLLLMGEFLLPTVVVLLLIEALLLLIEVFFCLWW